MHILFKTNINDSNWANVKKEIMKIEYFIPENWTVNSNIILLNYWYQIAKKRKVELVIEESYKKVLTIWAEEKDALKLARAKFRLSLFIFHAMNATEFSKQLMEDATENMAISLGEYNAETAQAINDLGVMCSELGQNKIAIQHYKTALKIRKKIYSEPNAELAESIGNVASQYSGKKALPHLREVYEIKKILFGPTHSDTINALKEFAATLDILKRHDEADVLYINCIRECELEFGEESLEVASVLEYYSIFLWHNCAEKTSQAVSHRALAINEKFYGKKSLELLLILESLAIAYFYDRKFSEAINHIERALKISIEFNGKNDFRSRHLKSTYKMIYDEDDKDLSKYDNLNSNRKTLN